MKKVKIKSLGKSGGFNESLFPWPSTGNTTDQKSDIQVNKTLKPVDKEDANIEAEKGETIVADMNHDGVTEHYVVGGERHSKGGTPLNVPDNAFVFSDTAKSRIKDENILKMFGMGGRKGGYTPAEIAKKYDINKYQQMLADPDTDDIQRKTAESMIANYNLKLAKLALVQESKKGFPTGIPTVAMPYMEQSQTNPQDFFSTESQQDQPFGNDSYQYGGNVHTMNKLFGMKWGGVPKYQDAGQVQTKKVPNIPKDTKIKNMGDPSLQVGDYVYVGGVPKKVTSLPPKPDFADPRIGGLQAEYAYLQNTLKDPELQDKIYENYKKHIEVSKMSPERKKSLLNKSKEDVVSNYLNFQKQTYAIHNAGVDLQGEGAKNWDTGKYGKNRMYKETMAKLGFKPEELLSDDQIAMSQAAHLGIADAYDDPSYKSKLDKFGKQINAGRSDQQYKGKNISPVDDWFGNTTAGQAFVPEGQEPGLENVDMIDVQTPVEQQKAVPVNHLNPPAQQSSPAPWWLQDVIKTAGAAGDFFRVKKYNPWQATPGVEFTDPTFYDPTRELAANAEQLNIISQGLSSYTGPQSYMANMSAAQGNAARNAADIMGRYNNLNVGVANQSDAQDAATYNQASAQKAALDTQLYDKYTIANQQFDNARNMARQNLRQSYIDAITNKNYTANLNDLFPQYNIDPSVGGRINFTHGRELDPNMASSPSVMAKAQEYKRMYPSFDDKTAFEAAKLDMGLESPGSKQHNEKLKILNALMQGQYGE